jgi:hypothetical protein
MIDEFRAQIQQPINSDAAVAGQTLHKDQAAA